MYVILTIISLTLPACSNPHLTCNVPNQCVYPHKFSDGNKTFRHDQRANLVNDLVICACKGLPERAAIFKAIVSLRNLRDTLGLGAEQLLNGIH